MKPATNSGSRGKRINELKKEMKAYRPVYPTPAALISSVDVNGKPNIITLGEVFNISIREPVILGIAIRPATYSHSLISESREFVINLPSTAILDKVDKCGRVSGRSGLNKFAEFGLTPIPSVHVRPPCIEECPVNIECRVIERITVGDHDLFLGKALTMHVDADKIDDKGEIDKGMLDTIVYITGEYWSIGQRIGHLGFTSGKVKADDK
jgi:flavin reductase (DIM6/NTAB) family NADH-FMN oxidoreductase RutF